MRNLACYNLFILIDGFWKDASVDSSTDEEKIESSYIFSKRRKVEDLWLLLIIPYLVSLKLSNGYVFLDCVYLHLMKNYPRKCLLSRFIAGYLYQIYIQ